MKTFVIASAVMFGLASATSLAAATKDYPVQAMNCGELKSPDGKNIAAIVEQTWSGKDTEVNLLVCDLEYRCNAVLSTAPGGTLAARWTPKGELTAHATPSRAPTRHDRYGDMDNFPNVVRAPRMWKRGPNEIDLAYDKPACRRPPPLGD